MRFAHYGFTKVIYVGPGPLNGKWALALSAKSEKNGTWGDVSGWAVLQFDDLELRHPHTKNPVAGLAYGWHPFQTKFLRVASEEDYKHKAMVVCRAVWDAAHEALLSSAFANNKESSARMSNELAKRAMAKLGDDYKSFEDAGGWNRVWPVSDKIVRGDEEKRFQPTHVSISADGYSVGGYFENARQAEDRSKRPKLDVKVSVINGENLPKIYPANLGELLDSKEAEDQETKDRFPSGSRGDGEPNDNH